MLDNSSLSMKDMNSLSTSIFWSSILIEIDFVIMVINTNDIVPTHNVDESRIVNVDVAFKLQMMLRLRQSRVEFVTYPMLEVLVERVDQFFQP